MFSLVIIQVLQVLKISRGVMIFATGFVADPSPRSAPRKYDHGRQKRGPGTVEKNIGPVQVDGIVTIFETSSPGVSSEEAEG